MWPSWRAGAVALAACFAPLPAAGRSAAPASNAIVDSLSVLGINAISTSVTNLGSFGNDRVHTLAAFEFPRGSGKMALFEGGLWIGARFGADTLVALSEYNSDFSPGAMSGSLPDDPMRPEYRVYHLLRRYSSDVSRDSALALYDTGARPRGAPEVGILADGTLDVAGDEMTWTVFNDADPARRVSYAGRTAPLGVEVQQTFFEYHRAGPLDSTLFLRYRIILKGALPFDQGWISPWADVDLGASSNDLVGCDTTRDLGFAYNADDTDRVYASMPVALGLRVLRGPRASGGGALGMTAFSMYIGGDDPQSGAESYRLLRGLRRDGGAFVDPSTGLPGRFYAPGDPVAGTGWRDTNPSDRRMMVDSGPFSMAPGDTQDVLAAIVLTSGADRLDAITRLRLASDMVAQFDVDLERAATLPFPTLNVTQALVLPGRVRLRWGVGGSGSPALLLSVERSDDGGAWQRIADLATQESTVAFEDDRIEADHTYGYRLACAGPDSVRHGGQTRVQIPRGTLRLAGFAPNPASGVPVISFVLGGRDPAVIEVFDVTGRRILRRDLAVPASGLQHVALDPGASLHPGVYLIRLIQHGQSRTARGVLLR